MKKTLFLSAILATALCSSAFAATPATVEVTSTNPTVDLHSYNGTNLLDGEHVITITMADETKITNGGRNCGDTSVQIGSITLNSADVTAELETTEGSWYGIINSEYSEATLNLNGGTLKKTGNGNFMIANTAASAGTFELAEGTLTLLSKNKGTYALNGAEMTLAAASGTTITVNKSSIVKELTSTGTTINVANNQTLTVGTLTLNSGTTTIGTTGTLTVTEGTTVNSDATLVMKDAHKETVTLNGGTFKVTSTGNFNDQHFAALKLTANSTLDLSGDKSGLINKANGAFTQSSLDLGENKTLTIKGTGRFCLMDVTTEGTGKLAFETANGYLQIAHSGTTGHTADLSTAVVEFNGTHFVVSGGNTVKVAALDQKSGVSTGSAIETEGSGTANLIIVGDGKEHTYRGGASASNIALSMTGEGIQNFSMSGNLPLASLTAEAGVMNFYLNNKVLSTGSLTLSGGEVNVFMGDHDTDAGQITTTNLTVEEATEMEANLVIADGGTLDFSSGAILTMGCDVTINGSEVTVKINSGELASIQHGTELTLITDIENLNLNEAITVHFKGENNQSLDGYGLRLEKGKDGISLVVTPEPATATLSLLALAGLAARRRRH